jgi:hypothetical protein
LTSGTGQAPAAAKIAVMATTSRAERHQEASPAAVSHPSLSSAIDRTYNGRHGAG